MKTRTAHILRYLTLFALDASLIFVLFLWGCFASLGYQFFQPTYLSLLLVGAVWALVISTTFLLFGFYRIAMSRIGLFESMRMVAVAAGVDVVFYVLLFLAQYIPGFNVPWVLMWPVFALMVVVHVFACVALRFLPRIFRAIKGRLTRKRNGVRTLLIGAGDAAKLLIDSSRYNVDHARVYVGAVDDDKRKIGTAIDGVLVMGGIDDAPALIAKHDIEEVIIAIPSLSAERYHQIVTMLSSCNVRLRKVPALHGDLDRVNEVKIVNISYSDLLGNPQYDFHEEDVKAKFEGKSILITGGGGSIGGEIALWLLRLGAKSVLLFDHYENGVAEASSKARDLIRSEHLNGTVSVQLGSVEDERSLAEAFASCKPDYVFHTAAVKHVPLAEDQPLEAVKANVLGTDLLCRLAIKNKTKCVYFLSTDKVIQPDSVMAKTKKIGEIACKHYGAKGKTAFQVLRFGNVLASKGSVVPLFSKQIEAGGPITVTSEDAARYFLTLEDCVRLILESSTLRDDSVIFDLETGKSTTILSLAEALIRQAGYIPYKDIDIVITGLRHGEATPKDHPYDRALQEATANPRIYIERESSSLDYEELMKAAAALKDNESAKRFLNGLVWDK